MKTIYETVTEDLIMREVEELRQTTISELDNAIEDIIAELSNVPFENSKEDADWNCSLTDRLLNLIILRRKSVKIDSFKNLNMEEVINSIIGY